MKMGRRTLAPKASYPFRSQLEKNVYEIIRRHFPDQEIKINKKGLIKSNKRLELDLYLPKYKLGIEIQGPLHTQNEKIILRDYEKKKLFLGEGNIKLIYVYTNTYENKKHSIKKCLDIINDERGRL